MLGTLPASGLSSSTSVGLAYLRALAAVNGLDLSPRELIEQHTRREVLELRFPVGEQETHAAELEGLAARVEVLPDRVLLYTDDADKTGDEIHDRGILPESTVSRRATLEDVFLRLTGRTLVD